METAIENWCAHLGAKTAYEAQCDNIPGTVTKEDQSESEAGHKYKKQEQRVRLVFLERCAAPYEEKVGCQRDS